MNSLQRFKTCAAAMAAVATLTAQAAGEDLSPDQQAQQDRAALPATTLTRAEVMAEWQQARVEGAQLAAGEIAETTGVIEARERIIVARAQALVERYARIEAERAAEQARLAALQTGSTLAQNTTADRPEASPAGDGLAAGTRTDSGLPMLTETWAESQAEQPQPQDGPSKDDEAPAQRPEAIANERRD